MNWRCDSTIQEGIEEFEQIQDKIRGGKTSKQIERAERFYNHLITNISGNGQNWINQNYEAHEGNFTPEYVLQKTKNMHPLQAEPLKKFTKEFLLKGD
ncbi:hypothetical protein K9L16_02925 [Candidatus Pacearchaeota archaeon]|nr:hypothetical protein [Candidatus Pacearchaeota archaeon]